MQNALLTLLSTPNAGTGIRVEPTSENNAGDGFALMVHSGETPPDASAADPQAELLALPRTNQLAGLIPNDLLAELDQALLFPQVNPDTIVDETLEEVSITLEATPEDASPAGVNRVAIELAIPVRDRLEQPVIMPVVPQADASISGGSEVVASTSQEAQIARLSNGEGLKPQIETQQPTKQTIITPNPDVVGEVSAKQTTVPAQLNLPTDMPAAGVLLGRDQGGKQPTPQQQLLNASGTPISSSTVQNFSQMAIETSNQLTGMPLADPANPEGADLQKNPTILAGNAGMERETPMLKVNNMAAQSAASPAVLTSETKPEQGGNQPNLGQSEVMAKGLQPPQMPQVESSEFSTKGQSILPNMVTVPDVKSDPKTGKTTPAGVDSYATTPAAGAVPAPTKLEMPGITAPDLFGAINLSPAISGLEITTLGGLSAQPLTSDSFSLGTITAKQEPALARHIAAQVVEIAQPLPNRPVDMTLSPEELGKVRLMFTNENGALTVSVIAERPETLDLMRRHIETLAQDLRNIGYRDVSFGFGQSGGNAGSDTPDEFANAHPDGSRDEGAQGVLDEQSQPPQARQSDPSAGIDIRL